jgi:hypothetical protein
MINIFVKDMCEKTRCFQTQPNPTREAITKLVKETIAPAPLNEFRYVLGNKQLNLADDAAFNAVNHLFVDNCTIYILMRLHGGGFVEVSLLWDLLLSELDSLIAQAPKVEKEVECSVCLSEEPCIKVCCAHVCPDHLRQNFRANNAQYLCYGPGCTKRHDLGVVLGSPGLSAAIRQFNETLELMKHINCQLCRCGRFMVNDTLWARQQCAQCRRTFCFFCNKDWQPGTMTNHRYHCSDTCDYKTKISYELVALAYNHDLKVPNRRCCPFCFVPGAYDEKCKYHVCPRCKKSFCFICLKAEADCKKDYGSRYEPQVHRHCAPALRGLSAPSIKAPPP